MKPKTMKGRPVRFFHDLSDRLAKMGMPDKDINIALALVFETMKARTALRRFHRQERRQAIERAYQRAMDIRDSTPYLLANDADDRRYTEAEAAYARAYRSCYRRADSTGLRPHTRRYLRAVRRRAQG